MTHERFYIVEPYIMDVMYPGLAIANWEALTTENPYAVGRHVLPSGKRIGLPSFPCPPKLELASKKRKRPPKDVEALHHHIWFVSDRFRQFAEHVDAEAFNFVECDNSSLRFQDRPLKYWACEARRFGSYLDEANSQNLSIRDEAPGWRNMTPLSATRIAVDRKLLGDAHVFSLVECSYKVFCDDRFRMAYRAAKMGPLAFTPV